MRIGRYSIHRKVQDDMRGKPLLVIHERGDSFSRRVFALTTRELRCGPDVPRPPTGAEASPC